MSQRGRFGRILSNLCSNRLWRPPAARRGAGAVGAWARVENAACARRLCAIADVLEARLAADGSAEREQWCLDNWDAVAAEVAAAQNVSLGVASHQLMVARGAARAAAAGGRGVRRRADLVSRGGCDRGADPADQGPRRAGQGGRRDGRRGRGWGPLSVAKTETEIDYWVDRYDPLRVRRTELSARGRHVDVCGQPTAAGLACDRGACCSATDADALDKRLDAMARAVCDGDPRTLEQRRADALGALAHGGDRLACGCGDPDCAAAGAAQRGGRPRRRRAGIADR